MTPISRIVSFTRAAAMITFLFAALHGAFAIDPADIRDIDAAKQFLRENPLQQVEGIWRFSDEKTSVVIAIDPLDPTRFILRALESDNANVLPGDTLGFLSMTPENRKFSLDLIATTKIPLIKAVCFASLTQDNNGIIIEKPNVDISPSPYMILSKFWRIINMSFNNPDRKIPKGLIRINPDNNAPVQNIIYL